MTVLVEVRDCVATITLNRPERRIALNLAMCDALLAAVQGMDASIKLVFVRASGPVFCAGADLKEREGMGAAQVRERRMKAFAAYAALEALPIPAIAVTGARQVARNWIRPFHISATGGKPGAGRPEGGVCVGGGGVWGGMSLCVHEQY